MANINTDHLIVGDDTLILQDADLRSKKVNSFQTTPDNNHYPSEKLVKDSLDAKLNSSQKGANNGVAELGSDGKVPSSQLPTIPDVSTKYDTGDTTETTLDTGDYIPFYDVSASARRKTTWSNIKAKLKSYFDGIYLTSHQNISGKADKVHEATSGNFASLDSNGNLADSGHKHSDYLTSHQDISGKADKVSGATNGDLAKLDSNGNVADSGVATSDVSDAVTKKHSHSNKTLLDKLPSALGSAGQVMGVASNGTSIEWKTIVNNIVFCKFNMSNNTIVCDCSISAIITACNSGYTVVGLLEDNLKYTTFLLRCVDSSNGMVFFDTLQLSGGSLFYYSLVGVTGNVDGWDLSFFAEEGAQRNVQSDWNQSDNTKDDYIKNRPTIPAAVSGVNDGTNWTSITIGNVTKSIPSGGGGGLSNYDLSFSTLSNNTTSITFEANQQCYKRMTMTAGATLNLAVLNKGCNYLRIYNSSASDITIAIGTVTYNGTAVTTKWGPDDAITVKAGKGVEIGVAADATEADITVSGTLKTL